MGRTGSNSKNALLYGCKVLEFRPWFLTIRFDNASGNDFHVESSFHAELPFSSGLNWL